MKKYIIISSLVAFVAIACSVDRTIEQNPGNAIAIRPTLSKHLNGKEFSSTVYPDTLYVYAAEDYAEGPFLMNGDEFVRGGDGLYSSNPLYYWPNDDSKEYCFFAYYPRLDYFNGWTPSEFHIDRDNGSNIEIPADISKHKDLIYSCPDFDFEDSGYGWESYSSCSGTVQLKLYHLLTQVQVRAKSANSMFDFYIKGVRLSGFLCKSLLLFGFSDEFFWDIPDCKNYLAPTSENTDDNYTNFTLNLAKEVKLSDAFQDLMPADSTAMILPQAIYLEGFSDNKAKYLGRWYGFTKTYSLINSETNEWGYARTQTGETRISFLLRVVNKVSGKQYFPYTTSTDASYGWACARFPDDMFILYTNTETRKSFKLFNGKKYTFSLDFTNGAGFVDPYSDDEHTDANDPFAPGDEILGGAISFTADMSEWGTGNSTDVNF